MRPRGATEYVVWPYTPRAGGSDRSGARWPYTPHRTRREQQSALETALERAAPLDRQMQRNCRLDRLGSAGRGAGSWSVTRPARRARLLRFLGPSHTASFNTSA
jgi:hypothetical protein